MMKKFIIFAVLILILGLITINAENIQKIEFSRTEKVFLTLPDGWYFNNGNIINENDVIVGVYTYTYTQEPFTDVQETSLIKIKELFYNNIILQEKLNPNLFLYTADNKNANMYCIVAINPEKTFGYTICIYSSRISYRNAVNLANSINIMKVQPNAAYLEFVEKYLNENKNYSVTDEYATEDYTVLLLNSKKIVVITSDEYIREITAYSFEGEEKYSEFKINSFDEPTSTLKFTRTRTDFDMVETFEVTLPNGEIKFAGSDRLASDPRPGTPIGYIYHTDIKAYIDGMPIKSYNVLGRTAVIVEDLKKYGFKVVWDGDERTLTANTIVKPEEAPEFIETEMTEEIGTVAGIYYATDIVTTINGIEYETYNLDGQIVVVIEDMIDKHKPYNTYFGAGFSGGGFKATWDNDTRTIKMYCLRPHDYLYTTLGEIAINEQNYIQNTFMANYAEIKFPTGKIVENILVLDVIHEDHSYTYIDVVHLFEEIGIDYKYIGYENLNFDTAKKDLQGTSINRKDSNDNIIGMLLNLKININNIKYIEDITAYYFEGKVMVSLYCLSVLLK